MDFKNNRGVYEQHANSQFHEAEIAIQNRLGVAEQVAKVSKGFIRHEMPAQHRKFFSALPSVIVGLADYRGFPWAIPLFGKPGFVSSATGTRLNIQALPDLAEFLELDFSQHQKIGMLGIDLLTRRRNRLNGVISEINENGFSIDVEQSFGNCPRYIQTRELMWTDEQPGEKLLPEYELHRNLDVSASAVLEKADTFFISSRTQCFDGDVRSGIDVSHRGGKPGFVKVDDNRIRFPDFAGNRFFSTLGNIESDERVGLVFPDYATGDAMFISGNARILWDDPSIRSFEGAERMIEISVERSMIVQQYMPMTGDLIGISPVQSGKIRRTTIAIAQGGGL